MNPHVTDSLSSTKIDPDRDYFPPTSSLRRRAAASLAVSLWELIEVASLSSAS